MADLSRRFISTEGNAPGTREEEALDLSERADESSATDTKSFLSDPDAMTAALGKLSAAVTSYITVRSLGEEIQNILNANKSFIASCIASVAASGILLTGALHSQTSIFLTFLVTTGFLLFNGVMAFSLSRKTYEKKITINDLFADQGFKQFLICYLGFCFMLTAVSAGTAIALAVPAHSLFEGTLPLTAVSLVAFAISAVPLLYAAAQGGLILPALAAKRLTSFQISLIQTADKTNLLFKMLTGGAALCATAVLFGISLQVSAAAVAGLCVTFFGLWTVFAALLFCAFYKLSGRAKDPNYELR